MSSGLPLEIEPLALTKRGATLHGKLALDQMPRLQEILLEKTGEVEVALSFGEGKFLPPTIAGQIQATLMVECERCGQPFEYPVNLRPELQIVRTEEQEKNLQKQQEALLLESETISLAKLVEDEILLSLPIVVRHKDKQCSVQIDGLR